MDLQLKNKKILITGASQGIGEGIARSLAAEGADLHLTARNEANLKKIQGELTEEFGVNIDIHPLDMTEEAASDRLYGLVGDVDILVNNAGAIPAGNLFAVDEAAWRAGWELKVMGYINMCRVFYGHMKDRGEGIIINNIGVGGELFDAEYVAGTTGNASLMAFTRALGGKSLDDGIRVVGVNPGPVQTERILNMMKNRAKTMFGDESRYPELLASFPLQRPAHVREVSDLIAFLASYRSGYTSGVIFTVDGGMSSRRSLA
ncbi:MAG: SDR family oxidoreductase [Proteobacteria bacterium]|nr:SDR family oxidoreductase [Pseudomonadota bacterium]